MSTFVTRTTAGLLFAAVASTAAAQVPPPPPPLPDEVRPVIVAVAPPAVRVERITVARPGPTYVWARGYWDWDGDSWTWVPGRWAVAPVARATWVPAQYVRVSEGYRYVPAHWSSQRVVSVETGRGKAVGHSKAKGKGHAKGKGKGHQKYD
jgi:WXXGXW repeat (2 copies)